MVMEKKKTKLDKIKDILIKRKERLERSLKFFTFEMNVENDPACRAKENLIEITNSRLEEINGILALIDLKNPLFGEWSFVNGDILSKEFGK